MAFRGWISAVLVAMVSALPVVRAACDGLCAAIAAPAPVSTDAAAGHCPSHPAPVSDAEVPDDSCDHAHGDGRITVSGAAAPIGHAIHAWMPVRVTVELDPTVARLGILPPLTPVPSHRLRFIPLRI